MRPCLQRISRLVVAAALPLVAASIPGCSLLFGSGGEPPRFFVLSAVAPSDPPAAAQVAGLSLGVGPISLPRYLDRDEIVTRVGENRLEMSRKAVWAEPVGANFGDVLIQDLEARLPALSVSAFPWRRSATPDYAVALDVASFEATAEGTAVLSARWRITDASGDVLARRESFLTRPIGTGGTEAAVAALGQAIAGLSDEIAQQLADVALGGSRR